MKSRMSLLATILVAGMGMFAAGCYAEAGTYVETESAYVYDASPTLVAVEPGIWVVSRQPTAVYYVDDYYWTYRDNVWYRSSSYNGGWVSADVTIVPVTIVHRDSTRYVYYNPPRGVATRPLPPPGHRATPGVRRGQTNVEHRPQHNEMGSSWRGNEPPGHSKPRHHDRGHGRGRGHGR
ncbi:MAG TPA: hypothetical protein PK156_33250 [Polyangium sp.]|nr:hypothetical protein [Polyangium sp.]